MSFRRRKLGILAGTLCGALTLCWADASVFGQSGWQPTRGAVNRDAGNPSDDDSDDAPPSRSAQSQAPAWQSQGSPSVAPARPIDAPRTSGEVPRPWYQQNPRQQADSDRSPTPAAGPNFPASRTGNYNNRTNNSGNDAASDNSSPTRPAGQVRRTAYQDSSYYTPNADGNMQSVQRPQRTRMAMVDGSMDSPPHSVSGPMTGGEEMAPPMTMGGPPGDDFMGSEPSCGCNSGHCSSCGCASGSCGCNNCCCPLCGLLCDWWQDDWDRDLTVSAGVQSFKSPVDAQNNPLAGHFGYYTGANWGTPIWDAIGLGGQIGVNFFESDLTNEESEQNEHRDQVFFTGGLFHRAVGDCGVQGGVVYDYLYDSHIPAVQHATLAQVRGDLSYVYQSRDFGFDFATSAKTYTATEAFDGFTVSDMYRPVDTYTLHYGHRLCGGTEFRVYGGYANGLGGLVGADFDVPVADHLSLNTNFMDVIPGSRPAGESQRTESWALGIALVWHPGSCTRECCGSPYRPLFNVADNGTFIVNEHISETTTTVADD